MLAVGRLLDDPGLVREALARLDGFMQRGFYHDGFWRQADARAQQFFVELWTNAGGGETADDFAVGIEAAALEDE